MRRLLSLFAFSLLVVGAVLAYESYRTITDPVSTPETWQLALLILGAAASLALGLTGLLERHRRRRGSGL